MNFWIESKPKALKRLLKRIDMFLLNEGEARELSGEKNLIKAADYIMRHGTKSVIIKNNVGLIKDYVLDYPKSYNFLT